MKPIVVSYYTENTCYEKEAEGLRRSVIKFGFDHDIVPKPNMGGWRRNTYYKAEFIQGMLGKYPTRNVLWLDADSAMIQQPVLFDGMKEDIGIFIADWKTLPGNICKRMGKHGEPLTSTDFLSGTLYVANNPQGRAVIAAWIALNKKNFDKVGMEQNNLRDVINNWSGSLTVNHLPPSYCQIFDIMAHLGKPVIEQYQAGRCSRKEVGV